jgi:tetratricopeptide (TPR) repeat protein
MRRLLLALLLTVATAAGLTAGYRVLSRDYRYFQLVRLGDELLQEGLPFQASRTYASAISLRPDTPLAYIKRAEAEQRQGNLAPALEDLQTAAALSSDVILVSLRLADVYFALENFEEAASHYREVLRFDPDSPSVLYRLGLTYFRAGREAEAIESLSRAASLQPGNWQALYVRGSVFLALGAVAEAESDFLAALEIRPEAEQTRDALIELYLESRAESKALEMVQARIDADPGDAEAYLGLADVHRLGGRRAEAIAAVGLALEQNPNLPSAYLRLGELWLEEADLRGDVVALDKAVTALQSVVKMDPDNGRAALLLGRAYLSMDDRERAFSELQRASQATPVQPEAHRILGDLYRESESFAEAITAYHVYLKLQGDDSAVMERLGDTYAAQSSPLMAADVYSRLAKLEPRRLTPLVKAARSFLAGEDPASAIASCRRGLSLSPNHPVLLELLAQARAMPQPAQPAAQSSASSTTGPGPTNN